MSDTIYLIIGLVFLLGFVPWSLFWYWRQREHEKAKHFREAKICGRLAFIPWLWILIIIWPLSLLMPNLNFKKNNKKQDMF